MEAVHLYGGAKVELYGGCMVEISQCISKINPKIYMHWMAVHVLLRLHVCFLTLDMRMYSTRNPDICTKNVLVFGRNVLRRYRLL
jgi:hypothetical protein